MSPLGVRAGAAGGNKLKQIRHWRCLLNSVTRYGFAMAAVARSALLPTAKLQAQSPAWTLIQAGGQNYNLSEAKMAIPDWRIL